MDKINVLLITGVVTSEHDYREMNRNIVNMLESTGRFAVRVTEDFDGSTPKTLEKYQMVLLNYDGMTSIADDDSIYWPEESLNALVDFVKIGGGIVFYHSSISLHLDTPDVLGDIMGAYLRFEEGSHRYPYGDFIVDVAKPEHPIMKGLSEHFMITGDDMFGGIQIRSPETVEILATSFDDLNAYPEDYPPEYQKGTYVPDGDIRKIIGINTDSPVVWTNRYGEGRVFCTSIGHGIDTMRRIDFLTMFVRGCEWAGSGEVTLDVPDRSGENRFKKWPYYS